jgi:hypothetical protein
MQVGINSSSNNSTQDETGKMDNGSSKFENQKGKGTKFTIELPVSTSA